VSVLIPDDADSKSPLIVPGLIAAEQEIAVLLLLLTYAWFSLPNTHGLLVPTWKQLELKLVH